MSDGSAIAGSFSEWLDGYQRVQSQRGHGADVPCGECNACCRSSYFIHIEADERETLRRIPRTYLARAPRPHERDAIMDHDGRGRCPMLEGDGCTIYNHRPQTCRKYDCRAFAAAGISLGSGPRREVNRRVWQWRFDYATEVDARRHCAVRAAATFLQAHGELIPEPLRPSEPGQLAKAAVAVHELFLEAEASPPFATTSPSDNELADAIVRRLQRLTDSPEVGDHR
ncbi:MAG: YkgJ family cysteine cluster protein [Polyangiales bacterium]